MSEEALLEKLMEKVVALNKIPLEVRLWDFTEIGNYMHRSPAVVASRIAVLPSFPKQVKIPSLSSTKGDGEVKKPRPLYRAVEIIDWTLKHQ